MIRALDTYRGFFSETCCRFLIQIITFEKKTIQSNLLPLTPCSTVFYKKAVIKNFEDVIRTIFRTLAVIVTDILNR